MQDDVTFYIYDSDGTPSESTEDLRYKVSHLKIDIQNNRQTDTYIYKNTSFHTEKKILRKSFFFPSYLFQTFAVKFFFLYILV